MTTRRDLPWRRAGATALLFATAIAAAAGGRADAAVVCRLVHQSANITMGESIFIDVDEDGQNDFQLQGINGLPPGGGSNPIFLFGVSAGAATCGSGGVVTQFAAGQTIDGSCPGLSLMNSFGVLMGNGSPGGYTYSPLYTSAAPYVGFQFQISGQTHFGWLEFATDFSAADGSCVATLSAIAYESVAGTAIAAGAGECSASADLDSDGDVDVDDLGLLLAEWGGEPTVADLDGDGDVDGEDLGAMLSAWTMQGK